MSHHDSSLPGPSLTESIVVNDVALSMPQLGPAESTIVAFWQKIAFLTTRTRREDGKWIGGEQVRHWNATNTQGCDKCTKGRIIKQCTVDEYQAGCKTCRLSRTACDRKTKFLFEMTRNDFFPTMDLFLQAYNQKQPATCRSVRKMANKRLKSTLPYSMSHRGYIAGEESVLSQEDSSDIPCQDDTTRDKLYTETVQGRKAVEGVLAKQGKMEGTLDKVLTKLDSMNNEMGSIKSDMVSMKGEMRSLKGEMDQLIDLLITLLRAQRLHTT
ncbi:hypothetical protein R3P38DRAFT_2867267 [Favolaschia claudopus]|uniref:Zn(2)-C6 fungal-type domain-containing protein n=1 Tax=Favolaschia claudopus TaxID=2862362 RepID=A0AAW0DA98_9AGAR